MNRRQFLSSVASVGVSAALPARAVPIGQSPAQPMLDQIKLFEEYHAYLWQRIMNTEEYRRFETELLIYGQSAFNPANAIAEIEPLDRPGKPWQACDAGDVPVQE